MKIISWIKNKLGITRLEKGMEQANRRLYHIEELVNVGVDLHYKTDSWAVICLKGKNQDVVRFFNLPHGEIAHIFELLKELERQYHSTPIFDAPRYLIEEYKNWKW